MQEFRQVARALFVGHSELSPTEYNHSITSKSNDLQSHLRQILAVQPAEEKGM
jgi:hypothetical protein